jgi:hypothetical protein
MTYPASISVGDVIDVGYDKRGFMVEFALVEKASDKGKVNMKINT